MTVPDLEIEAPALLRRPSFVRYWSARVSSTVAFQMTAVVVGWQVYSLTGSTVELGLVGLMQFLPMLLLTIPAGHVADRYDRRIVVRICQMVEGCATALLAVGSYEGWLSVHVIFAAVAVLGACRTFESPTVSALLPGVVPLALLPSALALSASATQTATIIGPALGGFLYVLGSASAYGTVAVLFFVSSVLVGGIAMARVTPRREPVTIESLLSGFVYIRDHPIVLGAISLDLFAVLLGGATALLPVYARDILHTSPIGLGLLRGAPAVGALTTSILLARHPLRRHVGLTMFAAVVVFGLATIVFGLSTSFPLSLAALVLLGASDVVSVVIRGTLVQLETPDAMRGRVSAVNSMFIGTSNQLGEFESGMTAALLGTVPAVVVGGLGTIMVAVLWSRLFPSLRTVQRLDGDRSSAP
ncbi:MFS transporter [Lichenihabitans psoromatis]|uniref:MFS transporter n=1 Tax=Lichenihabitans psoromatis TaxID=2528642 RepID=UPI001FE1DE31|nr:MFS transporter [Lichenihabitans psoromatis]